MEITGTKAQWFAVRTASGREKAVSSQLRNKGYEEFLPLYRVRRHSSGRNRDLEVPLFPGYLFCRFDVTRRLPILITPGVKLIVGFGRTPEPVDDSEVDALLKVADSGVMANPCQYLATGQRVAVRSGALSGVEGVLTQIKNSWRIVLSVELLRRSVSVEVDRASVFPVGDAPATAYRSVPAAPMRVMKACSAIGNVVD